MLEWVTNIHFQNEPSSQRTNCVARKFCVPERGNWCSCGLFGTVKLISFINSIVVNLVKMKVLIKDTKICLHFYNFATRDCEVVHTVVARKDTFYPT